MKRYFVNESERFNLDSMRTHLQVMNDDDYAGIKVTDGRTAEERETLIEEIEQLLSEAMFKGTVTGPQLGRIRQIVAERQMIRYTTCLAAGMSEQDAAYAFDD